MHPTIIKEIIALVLLVLFIGLFYLSMPPMAYMVGFAAVALMFVVFAVSIFTHTDRDEREEKHRMIAAESGFIAGGIVVLIAIAHQTFVMHNADPALFTILVVMLVVRLVVRLYLAKKQ